MRLLIEVCVKAKGPPGAGLLSYLLQRSRPNGSRCVPSPTVQRVSAALLPVQRLPPPASRSRLPVRVAAARSRQVKAAQGAGKPGVGALVLALTGVAHLSSRTGGSYSLLAVDAVCSSGERCFSLSAN